MSTSLLIALTLLVALLLALHLFRQYWTYRDLPRVRSADFEGELFRVNATLIARRPARGDSGLSVICHPGFLEDMRYFQTLYEESNCELILMNNADYHSPFEEAAAQPLDWPANPFEVGTIEHDGFHLAQVLKSLARGDDIILHGHSRGGAVILEAGRQFPDLMQEHRRLSAILEAPVLPRARAAGRKSDTLPHLLICYLIPIALGMGRRSTPEQLLKQPMMHPANALKTRLCLGLYTAPRKYATCVVNVRNIRHWQRTRDYGLYANIPRITVVVGARDDVLDNASMVDSAQRGRAINAGLTILHTGNTNYFISLEQPRYLLETAFGAASGPVSCNAADPAAGGELNLAMD